MLRVHRWLGIVAAVYVFVIGGTGAALALRIDVQRTVYPHLFTPREGPPADAATVLERLRQAYPADRVSGIDAPTTARATYLGYVIQDGRFLTLLIDPVTGRVLGSLPERSVVRTLQDLHFNLLTGAAGRFVNGVGAAVLLLMCATGLIIWWPRSAKGAATWNARALHRTVGAATVVLVAMWSVTGLFFAFPSAMRKATNTLLPLTAGVTPRSSRTAGTAVPTSWRTLIDRARERAPQQHVQRVVVPASADAAFLVMFSPDRPGSPGGANLSAVYLDQYTGEVLHQSSRASRTPGDLVVNWVAPLHVGNFGGGAVRGAWAVLGLAMPVLATTGVMMWRRRAAAIGIATARGRTPR